MRQPTKHNPHKADENKESKCSYHHVFPWHAAQPAALLKGQYAGRYNQGVEAGATTQNTPRPSKPITNGSFPQPLSKQSAITARG